jgi:hypothetical protein
MSHQATAWALEVRVGDPTLKALLMAIAHRADRVTWSCWPSLDCLAYDTEVSKRTIQRRLDELQERGFIKIEKRRRPDGTQDSSLITITGGQIVTLQPPVDRNGLTGGQKPGSPVDTAVHLKEQEEQLEQESTRAKGRKKDEAYSEDFEALWKQYPRTRNTSKKDAWNFYRMMTDEKQEQVRRAVPLFAAAMRAEGRTEDKIMHMIRFLRGGVYETVAAPTAPLTAGGSAKPFWETATRQDWINALLQWSRNWNWNRAWGPEPENPLRPNPPGSPKHHVPQDILDRFDLKYRGAMYSPEQKAEIQARVEAASKHAVDKDRAA